MKRWEKVALGKQQCENQIRGDRTYYFEMFEHVRTL